MLVQLLNVCRAKTVSEFLVGRTKEPRPPITSPYAPLSNELAHSVLLEEDTTEAENDESSEVESLSINGCSEIECGIDASKEVSKAIIHWLSFVASIWNCSLLRINHGWKKQ